MSGSGSSKVRLCPHGMTLEDGCMHCERVPAWAGELDELEGLRAVAIAAKALVQSASGGCMALDTELVSEPTLTALEAALAAAGYDLTDEELEEALADERPEDGDPYEEASESRFGLPGGGRSL